MSEYRIYKPNNNKNGSATKWQLSLKSVKKKEKTFKEWMVFLTGANQIGEDEKGNAKFDWSAKATRNPKEIRMKLGDADIGEILAVFNRKKNKLGSPKANGLFHKNKTGSTTLQIEFRKSEKSDFDDNFVLRLTSKEGNNQAIAVSHMITLGEAEILKTILELYVRFKYAK